MYPDRRSPIRLATARSERSYRYTRRNGHVQGRRGDAR
jgi:hypothetical protein